MARKTKKSKSRNNIFQKRNSNNTLLIIFFTVIFAVIGGYYIFKTFASTGESAGEPLLIEKYVSLGEEIDTDQYLGASDKIAFRLYKSGLAVCGDYSDSKHKEEYYSTVLNEIESNKLVKDVATDALKGQKKITGFGENDLVPSTDFQTISVQDGKVGKETIVASGLKSKPTAYVKASDVINDFCSKLSTPYVPEEIQVTTLVTNKKSAASNDSLPSEVPIPATEGIEVNTLRGLSASQVYKKVGATKVKKFNNNGIEVQVRVYPFQSTIGIVDGGDNTSATAKILKTIGSIGVGTASANPIPMEFSKYCNQYCDVSRNPSNHISETKKFFKRTISQTFDTKALNTVPGQHTWAWYRACHAYFTGTCTNSQGVPFDYLTNTLYNIQYEIQIEWRWAMDRKRMFLLGYNPQNNSGACGVSFLGGPTGIHSASPNAVGDCSDGSGSGYMQSTHEVGHLFGLDHSTWAPYTLMWTTGCSRTSWANCQLDQRSKDALICCSVDLYPIK